MNAMIRSVGLAASLCLLLPTAGMAQNADREAVDKVMQTFLRAYITADNSLAKEVFRADGVMIGYAEARGSALQMRTGEQFAEGFNGRPAANEAQRKRRYEIVDMATNLAAVRVMLDYPGWDGWTTWSCSRPMASGRS